MLLAYPLVCFTTAELAQLLNLHAEALRAVIY